MDALIASAGPLRQRTGRRSHAGPSRPKKSNAHKTVQQPGHAPIDASLNSIMPSTTLPNKYLHSNLATGSDEKPLRADKSLRRIGDKKLRAKLEKQDIAAKRAVKERDDVNEWLNAPLAGGAGGIEVDEDMGERTWRVKQSEIVQEVGIASGSKKFDLKMEGLGSYKVSYTRNGRHLAIASSSGHVATFDWQAGKLHSETYLKEAVRDITFLHTEAYFAVAQSKYVFIYDKDGVELHKMKQHTEPTHLEFLPYHFLLTSVGHAGVLKYHDTTTGSLIAQIPTRLGSPHSMAQNPHSGIVHLGHANGTMTLWSPNVNTPHVRLLAHRGPVLGMAIDPSERSAGRYAATAGMDGIVKIWDGRMWGKEVHKWHMRNSLSSIAYSGRGMLAVGGKSGVSIFRDVDKVDFTTTPYLTLPLPSLTASDIAFCPFDDLLCVGHGKGISSLLVPGSGEPNFDSGEADVFETSTRRREREVRNVLEKIRPELITLDTDFLGKVAERPVAEGDERTYRQLPRIEKLRFNGELNPEGDGAEQGLEEGMVEEEEEEEEDEGGGKKERHKMKGRGTGKKKHLRKKQKKAAEPHILAMKAKIAKQKDEAAKRRAAENNGARKESGALARFG